MKSGVIVAIAIVVLLAIVGGYFYLNSYDPIDPVCTQDAQLCPDGSYVGRNPSNNCEFFACPEKEKIFCEPGQRNAEACIALYKPVCGWFNPGQIQCVKYPCAQTYSNSCFACADKKVSYYTGGECPA